MKNLLKLICIIVLFFSVNSCGVQWQYQTLNTAGYVDTLRSERVTIDEINTVSQLRWKLQTDFSLANDYYYWLSTQNYSFFHQNYFYNRLYRFGWQSPHDYWLNWQWGFNTGYTYWNGWNQYPWYGNWSSNYWYWNRWNNPWQYSYVYGPRTGNLGNVYGWRYSNRNRFGYSNSNRSRSISVSDGSTSDSRTYFQNNRTVRTKPTRSTKPTIRVRPTRTIRINSNSNNSNSNNTIRINSSSRPNSNSVRPSTNSNRNSSRPSLNPSRSSAPKTNPKTTIKRKNPR